TTAGVVARPTSASGQAPAAVVDESPALPLPTPVTPGVTSPATTIFSPQAVIVMPAGPDQPFPTQPTISDHPSWVMSGAEEWHPPSTAPTAAPKLEFRAEYLL